MGGMGGVRVIDLGEMEKALSALDAGLRVIHVGPRG